MPPKSATIGPTNGAADLLLVNLALLQAERLFTSRVRFFTSQATQFQIDPLKSALNTPVLNFQISSSLREKIPQILQRKDLGNEWYSIKHLPLGSPIFGDKTTRWLLIFPV